MASDTISTASPQGSVDLFDSWIDESYGRQCQIDYSASPRSAAWDVVMLGGYLLPGLPLVDVSRSKRLDVVYQMGVSGATVRFLGYEPGEVSIQLTLATDRQIQQFAWLLNKLHPPSSKLRASQVYGTTPGTQYGSSLVQTSSGNLAIQYQTQSGVTNLRSSNTTAKQAENASPIAFEISHPRCTLAGITMVILESVELPHADPGGFVTAQLKFREFLPPIPINVKTVSEPSRGILHARPDSPTSGAPTPPSAANIKP